MAYQWAVDLSPGSDAEPDELNAFVGRSFETQQAAEAWLTGNYEELADLGAAQVSLFEEDRLVYGPMSLEA